MLRTVTRIRNVPREREIAEVFARHGFGWVLRRYALGRFVLRARGVSHDERLPSHWGAELRAILEELGPTFIKLGQVLSLRPDILPSEVLFALRGLRDQVTPSPFPGIKARIEEELGGPILQIFEEFDPTPIGSASIGQVYVAKHNGEKVAVKVQRPGADQKVSADMAVLLDIADVVRKRNPDLFFDPVKLVEELRGFLTSELDYLEEARNTDRIRADFGDDPRVKIPAVHWDRTTSRVITTEFIEGIPLSQLDPTHFTMEERHQLAVLGAQVSIEQVFEHGAFHGDAHPSNILVVRPDQYGLIDFGLVGFINDRELRVMTDYFIDLIRQRPERLVRDLKNMGVTIPRDQEDDVVTALAGLMRRYYGMSLDQIDTTRLVTELLDLFYRYKLRLPTKYFLILRGLTTVEGTGRELDPGFNVFEVAEPYVRRLAARRYSPQSLAAENLDRASGVVDMVARYPGQISDILDEIQDSLREGRRIENIVDGAMSRAGRTLNRVTMSILFAALVIGSSQVHYGPKVGDVPVFGAVMFFSAFGIGFWLLVGLVRSGWL